MNHPSCPLPALVITSEDPSVPSSPPAPTVEVSLAEKPSSSSRPLNEMGPPNHLHSSTKKGLYAVLWIRQLKRRTLFSKSSALFVCYWIIAMCLLRPFIVWSSSLPADPAVEILNHQNPLLGYLIDHALQKPPPDPTTPSSSDSPSTQQRLFEPVPIQRHPIVNGLLQVDTSLPASNHPIYQLMVDAKEQWDAKVARQSKTLEEAVNEYRRRYLVNPPLGFDRWWNYVVEHQVPLPDEYDQINRDLKPFRAFSPAILREKALRIRDQGDTFTLSVQDGVPLVDHVTFDEKAIHGSRDRINGQLALLQDVAQYIPDFEAAVYSIHDRATRVIGYSYRRDLLDLANDGEFTNDKPNAETSQGNWGDTCPPSSALAKNETDPVIPLGKSFIASHSATMDHCAHPSLASLHASFVDGNPNTQPHLMPVFSLSKTNGNADILSIPTDYWQEAFESQEWIPWEAKTEATLLWRGKNTGGTHSKKKKWRSFQRTRLVGMMKDDVEDMVKLLPTRRSGEQTDRLQSLEQGMVTSQMGALNRKMTNAGFALKINQLSGQGTPIQCDAADGTCEEIVRDYPFRPFIHSYLEPKYKYLIDVDGNAWSARFKRSLNTGSMVLKSTAHPEFWTDRIQPWLHYVPVKVDYTDIYDILTFFRGDNEDGTNGEDDLARQIAEAGLTWSQTHWRKEDMTAYVFRLYLEYARLTSKNPSRADFVLDSSEF